MKRYLFLVLALLMLVPSAALAKDKAKSHMKVEAGQECADCHTDQAAKWFEGKHGIMGVKCFVCHGAVAEKGFTSKPSEAKCIACHGAQVASAKAKLGAKASCYSCHNHHTLAIKFHQTGGK